MGGAHNRVCTTVPLRCLRSLTAFFKAFSWPPDFLFKLFAHGISRGSITAVIKLLAEQVGEAY
jgi:hypothetical protein